MLVREGRWLSTQVSDKCCVAKEIILPEEEQ